MMTSGSGTRSAVSMIADMKLMQSRPLWQARSFLEYFSPFEITHTAAAGRTCCN
jgi:hypothetical protein